VENVCRRPENDLPNNAKCGGIGNVNFGDREQTGDDLIGQAIEAKICATKPKADARQDFPRRRQTLFGDG